MSRRLLSKTSLLVLLAVALAAAQPGQILTLEKSVNLALDQNPDLKIAKKELKKFEAGVGEAYAAILPQINATANFRHDWAIQESTIPNFIKTMLGPAATPDMPDVVRISFGLENTFTYGATLTQPLFLGGAGISAIQSAKALKRAAEQNVVLKQQDIIYRTVKAFYGCLVAKELVSVQEEALQQAEANLEVVRKKYNVGMASGFDKMRAEVELANLRPNLINARNSYQMAVTGLRTVLGLDKNTEVEVRGVLKFSEDELALMTLSVLQELALTRRPELHALREQEKASQKGISLARSEFLPKLFFQTDYSFLAMRDNLNFTGDDFSKGFTSALSLQFPLFSGFRSARQYQKARLDYKIVLDTAKKLRDAISAEVELAWNKFNESRQKYESARETIELAREALRLANLMYEEGANTQLDVINSQLALTQARLNYISSLYDYQMARYELRKATGQLTGILD